MQKVIIKRIDKSLPLPEYQTSGAVAFDLYSRLDLEIEPKSLGLIPSNLIVKTPSGYMLLLAIRSSTPKRTGLHIPHGIGIIDQDYCGEKDELLIQVFNNSDQYVKIQKAERIGQAVFVKIDKFEFQETDQTKETNRGGFGSTKY